ncbi:acetylornithine aminotransferase [Leuconostoc litchii]|uniref:Aminotransferase class III-fold pyridoxal phosphate-dependent enzyme n=1 Tax=Leuconostoc litchii TaxID=1981069 RepID=A0A6P2CPU3_9LACO|nr:aminotransferase class III-fold pyridoxal phosphate-dependent enzyme [Leuconostoc litchii]TYC46230.1 aminotransferase class III-fold pyridoxal phosphate-dependent enzyme [Leuconostoc litchii]GMA69934.1 acetylornithine aminotransferase [Leuconostoc litchii]
MTLFPNYHRAPVTFKKAKNATWTDKKNVEYTDLSSGIGVYNVGANNDAVASALIAQAKEMWHLPNLYENDLQETVASKLGGEKYTTYFANSGTEANEAAIKLARLATKRETIITFSNSFHGRTYASMSATAQDSIHHGLPLLSGFKYAKFNDINSVKELLNDDVAGVMLELVQGEGGVFPADPDFIRQLIHITHENGSLIMIDEVQTGIGRTGKKFSFENYDFEPDIFTSAKALANGVPVGAMLAKNEFASSLAYNTHGSTFGGNLLAMSAANATLDELSSILPDLSEKISLFWEELETLKKISIVTDVRGLGMMAGIELKIPVTQVVTDLLHMHIIVLSAGNNTLRLLPPLTISDTQLKTALKNIKQLLSK